VKVGKFDSRLEKANNNVLVKSGLEFGYNEGPCCIDYVIKQRHSSCSNCGSTDINKAHSYTADFWFHSKSGKLIIVECKGGGYSWTSETRTKHLAVKKQYPDMDLRFIFSNKNSKISKRAKTSNAKWCSRQGFLCESKLIPRRWLAE